MGTCVSGAIRYSEIVRKEQKQQDKLDNICVEQFDSLIVHRQACKAGGKECGDCKRWEKVSSLLLQAVSW